MRNSRGFTLVEVIVIVAIFAIMAALSYSGMGYVQKHRLQSASRELLADLQRLRQDAVTGRTLTKTGGTVNSLGFGIRFDSATSYQLFEFDDCNGDFIYDDDKCPGPPANPSPREEIGNVVKDLPAGVTVMINDVSLPNTDAHIVLFDRNGMPRRTDWLLGPKTYVLRLPGLNPRCVSVSTVRIREGIWKGASCDEL